MREQKRFGISRHLLPHSSSFTSFAQRCAECWRGETGGKAKSKNEKLNEINRKPSHFNRNEIRKNSNCFFNKNSSDRVTKRVSQKIWQKSYVNRTRERESTHVVAHVNENCQKVYGFIMYGLHRKNEYVCAWQKLVSFRFPFAHSYSSRFFIKIIHSVSIIIHGMKVKILINYMAGEKILKTSVRMAVTYES